MGKLVADNPARLLTRDEVEAEYGLTRRFLEIAAWRGDGPPMIRISRRMVRYRAGDLEAWIEAHRVAEPSGEAA